MNESQRLGKQRAENQTIDPTLQKLMNNHSTLE